MAMRSLLFQVSYVFRSLGRFCANILKFINILEHVDDWNRI
jgi:hypothetical protein